VANSAVEGGTADMLCVAGRETTCLDCRCLGSHNDDDGKLQNAVSGMVIVQTPRQKEPDGSRKSMPPLSLKKSSASPGNCPDCGEMMARSIVNENREHFVCPRCQTQVFDCGDDDGVYCSVSETNRAQLRIPMINLLGRYYLGECAALVPLLCISSRRRIIMDPGCLVAHRLFSPQIMRRIPATTPRVQAKSVSYAVGSKDSHKKVEHWLKELPSTCCDDPKGTENGVSGTGSLASITIRPYFLPSRYADATQAHQPCRAYKPSMMPQLQQRKAHQVGGLSVVSHYNDQEAQIESSTNSPQSPLTERQLAYVKAQVSVRRLHKSDETSPVMQDSCNHTDSSFKAAPYTHPAHTASTIPTSRSREQPCAFGQGPVLPDGRPDGRPDGGASRHCPFPPTPLHAAGATAQRGLQIPTGSPCKRLDTTDGHERDGYLGYLAD